MRYSPQTILHFLANHYEALKKLYDSCKSSPILPPERLEQLGLDHLTIRLTDYKILRPLPNREYRFEERYIDFFAFLVSDFSLDLPDQLAKYQQSLAALFLKLQQATTEEEIRFIIQKIIQELNNFLAHLEDNTQALTQEVDHLRNVKRENITYTQQVKKAVYLIENFLEPLNLILTTHEEGIMQLIRSMIPYAHEKLLHTLDIHQAAPYTDLHTNLRIAEVEVQNHLSLLIDTLMPLLEQIKVGGPVLRGLKLLRDYYGQGQDEKYEHFLPKLHDKKPRNSPFKYNYELAAEDALESYLQEKLALVYKTTPPKNVWYFRESYYQKKLAESLPIENFFLWCYETLREEENSVDLHKFFKMTSLLFEQELKTTFKPEKQIVQLSNARVTAPYINVK